MNLNPYESCWWFTIVNDHWVIKIITKQDLEPMDWTVMLPKKLILFILSQDLPSPLKFTLLTQKEEIWGLIDAICYSPDMKEGFLTLKNLYYLTK